MPTPQIDGQSEDGDFEDTFIEIIDDRLTALRAEMEKLTKFRERLLERQANREAL
jgi:hypothetical protein